MQLSVNSVVYNNNIIEETLSIFLYTAHLKYLDRVRNELPQRNKNVRIDLCPQNLCLRDTAPNTLIASIRSIFISGDTYNP